MEILQILKAQTTFRPVVDIRSNPALRQQVQARWCGGQPGGRRRRPGQRRRIDRRAAELESLRCAAEYEQRAQIISV